MQKIILFIFVISLTSVPPVFAEGFSPAQFGALIVVNLTLGAVVTLFLVILGSAFLAKLKEPKKVEVRNPKRKR